MEKKNDRYEKPILDELDIVGRGEVCVTGTGAADACTPSGVVASGGCLSTGSSPAGGCTGGNNAVG